MEKQTCRGGMGFASILTLIFIVLKLVGGIDWSWLIVFLPIIISVGLTVLITIGVLIFTMWGRRK